MENEERINVFVAMLPKRQDWTICNGWANQMPFIIQKQILMDRQVFSK